MTKRTTKPAPSIWWNVTVKPKGRAARTVAVVAANEEAAGERAREVITQGKAFKLNRTHYEAVRDSITVVKAVQS